MSEAAAFDDLRALYQQAVMERARNPRHQRRLEPFDGAAKGDNPMCGDRVEVRLRMRDGSVAEAGFEARGCQISVASADLMVESVAGLPAAAVQDLATQFRAMIQDGVCCTSELEALRPLAGVHEHKSRHKCATLPWDALLAALKESKHG